MWMAALFAAAFAVSRTAAAATWEAAGLPQAYQYAVGVNDAGHLVASSGGTVYSSVDDGATWNPVGSFPVHHLPHAFSFTPSGSLFAADFALGVSRSGDGGATWSGNLAGEGCNGLAAHPSGVVMAGLTYTGNGRVHRSADNGASWQGVALPGSSSSFATECFAFGDSGETYAGTIDGFYRSADVGVSWQAHNGGLQGLHVRTMAVTPNQHVFVQTLFPAALDGLYRSVDRGRTWQALNGNDPYFNALLALPSGELYGTSDDGVWRSADEGVVWTRDDQGIAANQALGTLVRTPTGRLIAGGRRVWRTTTAVTGVTGLPREAALVLGASQPNPFARSTRIPFTLARRAHTELAVFDLAGRRVATLVDGVREAGAHAATFEARGLAAGVYLVRLAADGASRSRRVLVCR
jgi:hypothetical protein